MIINNKKIKNDIMRSEIIKKKKKIGTFTIDRYINYIHVF